MCCAVAGLAVPAPHVTSVVLLLDDTNITWKRVGHQYKCVYLRFFVVVKQLITFYFSWCKDLSTQEIDIHRGEVNLIKSH